MSDLVKTARWIATMLDSKNNIHDKYLVLPSGLDELQKILKDEIRSEFFGKDWNVHIDFVFDRFKKEQGVEK